MKLFGWHAASWLVLLLISITGTIAESCKSTLKFQTAPEDGYFDRYWALVDPAHRSTAPIQFYANRTAVSAVDCANFCYDDVIYFCNSALFEPSSQRGTNGNCKLSQRALPCLSTETRRKRQASIFGNQQKRLVHQVSESPEGRLLLFCFRCLEIEDEDPTNDKVTTAAATPAVEENSNERPDANITDNESVPVAMPAHEEREFDTNLNPNSFFQGEKLKLVSLRVMTFNTWVGGANVNNGIQKIANHISEARADVVALQETNSITADQVLSILGSPWRRCRTSNGDSDYILTRHPIVEEYQPSFKLWNSGCRIRISEFPTKFINVWGVHLDWRDYGPYTVCFERSKRRSDDIYRVITSNEHKHRGERTNLGRVNNILGLLNHEPFATNMQASDTIPLIVAGDFNTPSHLDWTEQMRLLHCNASYEWPVSKVMLDSDFKDSYRQVYPNPGVSTGFTWTPLYKINPDDPNEQRPEPQDRIDFIYYRGKGVRAKQASVYKGFSDMRLFPTHKDNDWPSDHAAVITDFDILVT